MFKIYKYVLQGKIDHNIFLLLKNNNVLYLVFISLTLITASVNTHDLCTQ